MISFPKTITPLFWRVIVFLCVFIAISGVIGPKVISGGILYLGGFAVYGGVGKALIFSLIAFVLLARHKKTQVALIPWHPKLLGWAGASLAAFILAWTSIDHLLAGWRDVQNLMGAHAGLLLSLVFAAISCLGLKNIRSIWRKYKREMIAAGTLGIAFYFFLLIVYALWRPLASIVLISVTALLDLSGLDTAIIPPHTLMFDKFGITIAEFCSGVESIALFTSLYAVVGLLDWQRLHKRRYFIVFPFALVVLFLFNILRVYGLIMAGYYINPEIAFSLFHTYAGMVFFILYSAVFWAVAYKYLVIQPDKKETISREKR